MEPDAPPGFCSARGAPLVHVTRMKRPDCFCRSSSSWRSASPNPPRHQQRRSHKTNETEIFVLIPAVEKISLSHHRNRTRNLSRRCGSDCSRRFSSRRGDSSGSRASSCSGISILQVSRRHGSEHKAHFVYMGVTFQTYSSPSQKLLEAQTVLLP